MARLDSALREMQDTVRTNEVLRADKQKLANEASSLQDKLKSSQQLHEQTCMALEQRMTELSQRNLQLETENQLLKQRAREDELTAHFHG